MKVRVIILSLLLASPLFGQEVQVVQFAEMEKVMKSESSKLKVYNFWATWCRPCIIEMPYFEEMAAKNREEVQMVFVSLDFADEVETKVEPFLQKRKIKSPVYLVDDLDYNSWIERVDPSWTGALPATVFVTPDGVRFFYEKEFKSDELQELVKTLLNQ